MKYTRAEIITGVAVILAAIVFGAMIFRSESGFSRAESYPLKAEFVSAEGIHTGGEVRMAGVKIGQIGKMNLNKENYMADVELLIDKSIRIPTDSEVKIASEGLLGGNFVEIIPGADIVMLGNGEQFTYASGSVSLISLFASLMGNRQKEDNP